MSRSSRRFLVATAAATALVVPLVAGGAPASAASKRHGHLGHGITAGRGTTARLPAPPRPPKGRPTQRAGYVPPTALVKPPGPRAGAHAAAAATPAVAAPPQARTWGPTSTTTTLVVYDSTGSWGWLGELYAVAGGNLASHFGRITAEPVANYVSGQVGGFTSTIYLGSTYNEPIPTAFLNDVLTTTHPVVWAADNVWQLSGAAGGAADTAFQAKYGWDPSTSYFDTTDTVATVSYKGQTFSRAAANGDNILAPHIVTPSTVTSLAQANCTTTAGAAVACASIAQSSGTSFPWAIRSSNLTFIGEVPFSYITESDRYIIFADLLYAALAPTATPSHQALVRLEDVNPTSDPTVLRQFADYLSGQGVPFSVGVVPEYTDPNGTYNNGVAQTITLAQAPAVVAALTYLKSKGGTLIQHGFTHQFSTVANPYNGVSVDDAEFYRAQCATTQNPPYTFDAPCQNTDWVTWTGPVPGDSTAWATNRVTTGRNLFTAAGLTAPTIWETPHYFASPADYAGIDSVYSTRYERELFVGGQLSGAALNYSHTFGQFFPYVVHDVYGEKIIPENLGNYEPAVANNNPPRLPADIIHNAQVNLAVTQGVASFFFHPDYPLAQLQQIVAGIKGLGYTFVAPTSVN